MPITQLNTADFDYEMMLNVINKSYKGKADITLSEYSTTAAPDVKVGSVFEDNGAIFIVDTSDITPSGYGGISNSTTFYLYYDEDPGAIIYSSTAPTWNDALQGWYNSNDRAFFSMFKDSGGTLYQNKIKMSNNGDIVLRTKVIEIGNWDMDFDFGVDVAHGLEFNKIRSIDVLIMEDTLTNMLPLVGNYDTPIGSYKGGYYTANETEIGLSRTVDGIFDTTSYDTIPFNRGWITIIYEG